MYLIFTGPIRIKRKVVLGARVAAATTMAYTPALAPSILAAGSTSVNIGEMLYINTYKAAPASPPKI